MAYFPFMMEVAGKSCLIAGGGRVAAGKAEAMLEFGALVTVAAPEMTERLQELARCCDRLVLLQREIKEKDILDADMVILATDDETVNTHMAAFAREHKILVNVVDAKEECSFCFPAILRQKDVVIAVSTGGKSPLLAAEIKKEIQKTIRADYGEIAEFMGKNRQQVLQQVSGEGKRKKVFREMLKEALDGNAQSENPHRHQGQ